MADDLASDIAPKRAILPGARTVQIIRNASRAPSSWEAYERLDVAAPSNPSLRNLRLLVAGVSAGRGSPIAMGLERTEAFVVTASTCAHATLLLWTLPWDVLVSDLVLPDGSGHDLARIARELTSPPTCIALSDSDGPDELDDAKRAGFRVHVRRPCDPKVLAALVEHCSA